MSLRTPSSNVTGLGFTKEGAGHWWAQRLTSMALVPLTLWLAFTIACFHELSYSAVIVWMQSPLVAATLAILVVVMFYHLQLGAQEIIADYVRGKPKTTSLMLLNISCITLVFIGLFSIIKVYL